MNWNLLLNSDRLRSSNRDTKGDARNEFESDFGRIIFSPALRRMHDKTQVFPLTTDDNIHSRLTHSMEVMSVGYSLAVKLCESDVFINKFNKNTYDLFREVPIIIKNCCLIHDIGNPPFGHFGETVIQNYFKNLFQKALIKPKGETFSEEEKDKNSICLNLSEEEKKDFLEFDGNAQGLRVITKLQILNDIYGLNLTKGTLSAYIKYPNFDIVEKNVIEKTKHGIFVSEKDYFNKIVEDCGLKESGRVIRNPLCYLMEAADSISYLTMDIEDGYNKNLFDLEYLYKKFNTIPSIKDKIEEIYKDEKDYYKTHITKVVNFRILIIKTLVNLAFNNFEKHIDKIEAGVYNEELINDDSENKLSEILRNICAEKIFTYRDINSLEITGHSVIGGILDFYSLMIFSNDKKYRKRASALISKSVLDAAFTENGLSGEKAKIDNLTDYYKLRIIVDFVSGMTDQYALNHYQKLSGQKII